MNIVVVEDSPVMQRVLLSQLARVPGLNVVGVATGEPEAIELIGRVRPDLVLLDLFLSPGHGLKVLEALRQAANPVKVLVLSNELIHEEYRQLGEKLDVLAFHDKGEGLGRLLADLHRVVGEPGTPRN